MRVRVRVRRGEEEGAEGEEGRRGEEAEAGPRGVLWLHREEDRRRDEMRGDETMRCDMAGSEGLWERTSRSPIAQSLARLSVGDGCY